MTDLLQLPETCQAALTAIEQNPLGLPRDILAHLQGCPACAEARILWLAQEDFSPALAPAGYFDRLPGRLLGKLPPVRRGQNRRGTWIAAAAALLVCTAGAAFWAGRLNRTPLVEAANPKAPAEVMETQMETPFHDRDEILEQLQSLPPDEAAAVLKGLAQSEPKP